MQKNRLNRLFAGGLVVCAHALAIHKANTKLKNGRFARFLDDLNFQPASHEYKP